MRPRRFLGAFGAAILAALPFSFGRAPAAPDAGRAPAATTAPPSQTARESRDTPPPSAASPLSALDRAFPTPATRRYARRWDVIWTGRLRDGMGGRPCGRPCGRGGQRYA